MSDGFGGVRCWMSVSLFTVWKGRDGEVAGIGMVGDLGVGGSAWMQLA